MEQNLSLMRPEDAYEWRKLHYVNQVTMVCQCPTCRYNHDGTIRSANLVFADRWRQSMMDLLWQRREDRRLRESFK